MLPVVHGTLVDCDILFPAGSAGTAHLVVYYHERQILPLSGGEAFRGDDHLIQFPEQLALHERPYLLELRGWAPEATEPHTVYVGVTVVGTPELPALPPASIPLPEGFEP